MAIDKAIDSAAHKAELKSIADSIRAKGGTTALFNSAAEMKAAVDAIQTGGPPPVIQPLTVTENGEYIAPDGVDGYSPVSVNVQTGGGDQREWLDALISGDGTNTPDIINTNALNVRERTFMGFAKLQKFEGKNVTAIKKEGLSGCYNLSVVDAPNVQNIDDNGLRECRKISEINFPVLKKLGAHGFRALGLTTVNLPAIEEIRMDAFYLCNKLKIADFGKLKRLEGEVFYGNPVMDTLIIRADAVAVLDNISAFYNTKFTKGTGYIYVPKLLVDQYKVTTNWISLASQFRAIEDYPDITGG